MPACPKCGTGVRTPTKTWTIPSEPDSRGRLLEQTVGLYQCAKCGEKFPHVYGRQKLKIISVKELEQLDRAVNEARAENQVLHARIKALEAEGVQLRAEILRLQETLVLTELQSRLENLRRDVFTLRREKTALEEEVAAQLVAIEITR